MTHSQNVREDPTFRSLSEIAKPFVIALMQDTYNKQGYSPWSNVPLERRSTDYRNGQQEAFQLYVQEACKQGYSSCSSYRFGIGFALSDDEEKEKDSTVRRLSEIAEPFVIGFMYGRTYSEEEAFQLYAQEVYKLGDIHCSNNQFLLAFTDTCSVNR